MSRSVAETLRQQRLREPMGEDRLRAFSARMEEFAIVEVVEDLFREKGWDERVPELISWWLGNSGYYLDTGLHPKSDIKLCQGTEGRGRPITVIAIQDDWQVMGYDRQKPGDNLTFKASPVGSVRVVSPREDEDFEVSDLDNKIEFSFPNAGLAARIDISGNIKFVPLETA